MCGQAQHGLIITGRRLLRISELALPIDPKTVDVPAAMYRRAGRRPLPLVIGGGSAAPPRASEESRQPARTTERLALQESGVGQPSEAPLFTKRS
jgi:hypothetical protein